MRSLFLLGLFSSLLVFSGSLVARQNPADIDPEAHTGITGVKRSTGQRSMVVTANPHATAAANSILSQGGSALDAAIAAQLVLGLVEPQSSGIGGGAFMMHWDSSAKRLALFDGRETAPASIDEQHFIGPDQKPMQYFTALIGGHSVGVPGVIKMLALAHEQHGKLPWSRLFDPAITLARDGFEISPRLHALLERFNRLLNHPSSRSYFYLPSGEPRPVGYVLKNPDYAATLELLAKQGEAVFYQGVLADAIVAAVKDDPVLAGALSKADMRNYRAIVREPLCSDVYSYHVCSVPPPSSGVAILQILGIMEALPQPEPEPASVDWIHRFAEASRLAFADRDTYVADPDFVSVPARAMIDKRYLQRRAALINLERAASEVSPGKPDKSLARLVSTSPERPSTTHLSIIDAEGNAIALTSSVQMAFGSGIMVGGFLLNNQLTDFSFVPRDGDQQLIANRVQPGKRPRSSMSPTIVFRDGVPVMLIGSPGGSRIVDYVARVLAYTLAGGMDIAEAIASPNITDMNRGLELEQGRFAPDVVEQLEAMGHTVKLVDHNSGLHGIYRDDKVLVGGADPRREGVGQGL